MGESATGDRLKAGGGVAALHGLLLYLMLASLGANLPTSGPASLKLFDVPPPRPPSAPPPPPDSAESAAAAEGQSSPPNLAAPTRPSRPPEVATATPAPAPPSPEVVPVPDPRGTLASGAADIAGPGVGLGGAGDGQGTGGRGLGDGGGGSGFGERAQRRSGALRDSDYPRSAAEVGAEGTVFVRFEVDPNGRVGACSITRSSGNRDLDATTCRLIQRRFRYRPARDSSGRPISDVVETDFTWGLRQFGMRSAEP